MTFPYSLSGLAFGQRDDIHSERRMREWNQIAPSGGSAASSARKAIEIPSRQIDGVAELIVPVSTDVKLISANNVARFLISPPSPTENHWNISRQGVPRLVSFGLGEPELKAFVVMELGSNMVDV